MINGARLGMCCNLVAVHIDVTNSNNIPAFKKKVQMLYKAIGELELEITNPDNKKNTDTRKKESDNEKSPLPKQFQEILDKELS